MSTICSSVFLLVIVAMMMGTTLSYENNNYPVLSDNNFISWEDFSVGNSTGIDLKNLQLIRSKIITVSKDGTGNATTITGAIDMVPQGNSQRIMILVSPGIYQEKVTIPVTKPYISLIGTGKQAAKITWNSRAGDLGSDGNPIGTYNSFTFAVEADYFCANNIIFENSAPAAVPGGVGQQAVALRLSGDKIILFQCKILGTQDTLYDSQGRHYFYRCFIQGSIDFIFGNARSLYQECTLNSVATGSGAVAAQKRESSTEDTGFSFVGCRLTGSGRISLGRAWGKYSTIVYAYSWIDGIIIPDAWSDWGDPTRQSTAFFAVYGCRGAGASVGSRVRWSKTLTHEEEKRFTTRHYIDGSQWLKLRRNSS